MQKCMFGQRPTKGLTKALKRADTDTLARCISRLYLEYVRDGNQPGAEKWSRCVRHRAKIMDRVFQLWHTLSGEDAVFPWSEDYVIATWVVFRKQSDCEKTAWIEWSGQ